MSAPTLAECCVFFHCDLYIVRLSRGMPESAWCWKGTRSYLGLSVSPRLVAGLHLGFYILPS